MPSPEKPFITIPNNGRRPIHIVAITSLPQGIGNFNKNHVHHHLPEELTHEQLVDGATAARDRTLGVGAALALKFLNAGHPEPAKRIVERIGQFARVGLPETEALR